MRPAEFIRDYVRPAGGRLARTNGPHHVYAFPNGRTLPIPVRAKYAYPYLLRELKKITG